MIQLYKWPDLKYLWQCYYFLTGNVDHIFPIILDLVCDFLLNLLSLSTKRHHRDLNNPYMLYMFFLLLWMEKHIPYLENHQQLSCKHYSHLLWIRLQLIHLKDDSANMIIRDYNKSSLITEYTFEWNTLFILKYLNIGYNPRNDHHLQRLYSAKGSVIHFDSILLPCI